MITESVKGRRGTRFRYLLSRIDLYPAGEHNSRTKQKTTNISSLTGNKKREWWRGGKGCVDNQTGLTGSFVLSLFL